jgi:single-strand DNA-binding protein
LNKIILLGRLVRDPELRYAQSGTGIASFTLAVDRRFKNANGEKQTDFINCKAFGKLAELVANYLAKGRQAAVTGSLQINSYTDKEGNKKYSTDVVADEVEFIGGRQASDASDNGAEGPYVPTKDGSFLGDEVNDECPF